MKGTLRLALVFVIVLTLAQALPARSADAAGPMIPLSYITIRLSVEIEGPGSGSVDFYMGNGTEAFDPDTEVSSIDLGLISDGLLRAMFRNLTKHGTDDASLFAMVLDSDGDPVLEDITCRFEQSQYHIGVWMKVHYDFGSEARTRQYRYLQILSPFHLPEYDPSDWRSVKHYEEVRRDFSRVSIGMDLESQGPLNLDIRGDTSSHRRDAQGERAEFQWGLPGYSMSGHEFIVSGSAFFAPGTLLMVSIFTCLLSALIIAASVWRRRFRRWAWIFPMASVPFVFGPFLFYFEPSANPYGLLDCGLITSCVIALAITGSNFFVPDGRKKAAEIPLVEEELPKFEMPEIMYVDRPVIIRKEEDRGKGLENDPYHVLGLSKGSTDQEIDKAYRTMVLRYHPDKVNSAPEWVKEEAARKTEAVVKAYERIREASR